MDAAALEDGSRRCCAQRTDTFTALRRIVESFRATPDAAARRPDRRHDHRIPGLHSALEHRSLSSVNYPGPRVDAALNVRA